MKPIFTPIERIEPIKPIRQNGNNVIVELKIYRDVYSKLSKWHVDIQKLFDDGCTLFLTKHYKEFSYRKDW
jgi:hypothetical protein